MDMKLELVVLPVTDVDRAKEFYERGRLPARRRPPRRRAVPASCSSRRRARRARSPSAPGSPRRTPAPTKGLHLVVTDLPGRARRARRTWHRRQRAVPLRSRRAKTPGLDQFASELRLVPRRSATPTATDGCSRRSRLPCADTFAVRICLGSLPNARGRTMELRGRRLLAGARCTGVAEPGHLVARGQRRSSRRLRAASATSPSGASTAATSSSRTSSRAAAPGD